ncbi:MAG: DUF389 domain-containing protein [Kofleriaceae bacterium]
MLLLRIVAPPETAATVVAYLEGLDVFDLIHFPGVSRRPKGDLIQCVVGSDLASVIVSALRELGVSDTGSITIDRLDATVAKDSCSDPDPGVVVWEEVEAKTATMAELSTAFLLYMMAATVIAAVGILTDSVVLIIGAMVVGPEFGPLCGLSVGLIQRRRELVRQSMLSLGVGFALAFAAAFVATWAFRSAGVAPEILDASHHPATLFISRPDVYTVVIAALCGVVGMLSLTTASAGTLIGVLISVTTIPAAGNVGVAAAYGNTDEMVGALIQLGVNLTVIQIAGLITLRIQRAAFASRVTTFVERLRRLRLRRILRR